MLGVFLSLIVELYGLYLGFWIVLDDSFNYKYNIYMFMVTGLFWKVWKHPWHFMRRACLSADGCEGLPIANLKC